MITVPVPVPGGTYDVLVGSGILSELGAVVPDGVKRIAIVTQDGVRGHAEALLADGSPVAGVEARIFTIGDGEAAKSIATVEELCRAWATWGLTRRDLVVGVGGGVVTDTAGYAAASYHRGTAVVHVPTTLLGMVDAAIGGKTGVNIPEGKNLIGAFWQPSGVLCDLTTLETLPPRELRSGLGEVAKYHFLPGGEHLDTMDFDDQVAQCVRIKAEVVASDEREGGRRAILNYGHTLAHAIETAGTYDLRHGEAVAVGLVYAASLARRLGRIDAAAVERHRNVLARHDLPTALPDGLDDDELVALMGRDKKAIDGLTFALDGPSGVEIVAGVDETVARATLDDVRTRADR